MKNKGKIYIVSTHIGNVKDISERALDILKTVDIIACENMEYNKKFLISLCGEIRGKFTAYYDGNELETSVKLIHQAILGKSIALISSAGTPLICDPGYKLIKQGIKKEIEIIPVPGPCAIIAALSCSGCPPYPFTFFGFFPKKSTERIKIIDGLTSGIKATAIFYESSHRIKNTTVFLYEHLIEKALSVGGNQWQIILIKDITKYTFQRIELNAQTLLLFTNPDSRTYLGEWVLLISY